MSEPPPTIGPHRVAAARAPSFGRRWTLVALAGCIEYGALLICAPLCRAADEVHWTITGPTSVTLNWRGCETFVRYGVTPAYGSMVGAEQPDPVPRSNPGPFWQARVAGLRENTLYHYSIGHGPDHTFRTPPRRGSSGFTAFAAGDVGDSAFYWRVAPLQDLIASHTPNFVLMLGDLTYANDHGQVVIGRHFNDVMKWSQDAAYMPAWGNHEWDQPPDDDLRNYKGRFDLPNPRASPDAPPQNGGGEDWSWFDYGNVRFIAYPEPYTAGTWTEWLPHAQTLMTEAQADPAITFIVTYGHRPAYSTGNHGGHPALKSVLDQLGATFPKYVLNLSAHSHNYERSHPQSGVIHITAGMGGSNLAQRSSSCLWEGGCPPPAWSAFRAMRHGAFRLRFTETAIEGSLICGPPGGTSSNINDIQCTPGDIIDHFTIGTPTPTATYYVDANHPACSDAGSGSEAQPYCTIGVAVSAHAGPGVRVVVRPGTYPEQITVPASGLPGSPFVMSADPGVILEGAESLSSTAAWTPFHGNVWLAPEVPTAPKQVLVDGVRQLPGTGPPPTLGPGHFLWQAGEGLYLNVGGGNPGLREVHAGRRNHGFLFTGISDVVVEGFDIRHADDRGVQIHSGSSRLTLRGNTIRFAGAYGMQITGGSQFVIENNQIMDCANHGISLVSGVTGSTLSGNESCRNARPAGSGANGISIHSSPGNVVIANRVHGNQDSGLQLQNASDHCTLSLNRSWSNGDHGIDQLSSTGARHFGNVAWGNLHSGFSLQGFSTGSRITNCIATDNGLTQSQYNLSVDATSAVGLTSNANLFWNSNGQRGIRFGSLVGVSLADYQAATGRDQASIEADPRFVDPAAGDFRLAAGSPAIDSGDSAYPAWSAVDAEGHGRFDAIGVWDTGTGPVSYSDRGALEHHPVLPLPALQVRPATGVAPLIVTLDAGATSGSGPLSFEFDCGDGMMILGQPWPDPPHIYEAGSWLATLWVTDGAGGRAHVSTPVVAAPELVENLVGNPSFEVNTSGWSSLSGGVMTRVPVGFHGGWSMQVSGPPGDLNFGVNDSPSLVGSTVAGTRYRVGAWMSSSYGTGQVTMRLQEFQGSSAVASRVETAPLGVSCQWQHLTMDYVARRSGSNLDIQIQTVAGADGETFLLDHVTAHEVRAVTAVQPDSLALRPMVPVLAPNPVVGAAWLRFVTSQRGPLRVEIFDIAGRRVRTLLDEPSQAPGEHAIAIRSESSSGTRLGAGLYFYRVQALEGSVTRRFLILR